MTNQENPSADPSRPGPNTSSTHSPTWYIGFRSVQPDRQVGDGGSPSTFGG